MNKCKICEQPILENAESVLYPLGENDDYNELVHKDCANDKSDFGFVNRFDEKTNRSLRGKTAL